MPARNEADRPPACLNALAGAAAHVAVDVRRMLIVLGTCEDDSLGVVQQFWGAATTHGGRSTPDLLEVSVGNVGAARAAGLDILLAWHDSSTLWLANTDADSTVPGSGWRQLTPVEYEIIMASPACQAARPTVT